MPDHPAILSGIKVIELATFVCGPGSTAVMGDFGADVMTALCRRERTHSRCVPRRKSNEAP
jgi:crotonobetainyl-CoA:carnitine CoA-transferase CaiB-like acyl-CoA transferase